MAAKKGRAGGRPAKNGARAEGRDWLDADRRRAIRTFVETQSIRETARRTGIPLGTVARWLDDPRSVSEMERVGTAFAREVAAEDGRIAREATQGLREGVAICRALLNRTTRVRQADGTERVEVVCDPKEAAALTRALTVAKVAEDRITRLNLNQPTDHIVVDVPSNRAELEAELRAIVSENPDARALLHRLALGG